MEIGAVRPTKCYNCNKNGHMARECKEPKREKGSCFYCGKMGHMAKECRKKKADREKSTKIKKTDEEELSAQEEEETAQEVGENEMADFMEGSD